MGLVGRRKDLDHGDELAGPHLADLEIPLFDPVFDRHLDFEFKFSCLEAGASIRPKQPRAIVGTHRRRPRGASAAHARLLLGLRQGHDLTPAG
jgi:hypothetical protein